MQLISSQEQPSSVTEVLCLPTAENNPQSLGKRNVHQHRTLGEQHALVFPLLLAAGWFVGSLLLLPRLSSQENRISFCKPRISVLSPHWKSSWPWRRGQPQAPWCEHARQRLDRLCSAITNTARENLGSVEGSCWLLLSRQTLRHASAFDQACCLSIIIIILKDLSFSRHISMLEKPTRLFARDLGLCASNKRHWICKTALAVHCCPEDQCFFLTSGLITLFLGAWRCPKVFCLFIYFLLQSM